MKLRFLMFAFAVLAAFAAPRAEAATEYFVAPLGAAPNGTADGSKANPWLSIGDAFSSGKVVGGDTLLLLDGNFGLLRVSRKSFDTPVTIQSLNQKGAHFEQIEIGEGSRNLTFKSLEIWMTNPAANRSAIVYAHPNSSDITLENLDIRGGGQGSKQYLAWGQSNWDNVNSGIRLGGPNSVVRGNTLIGVGVGITTTGPDALVEWNQIEGYSADGMRGLGNRSVFRNNQLVNSVQVNENHDDGFQSWAPRGVPGASMDGLIIEGNSFIEWTGPENHPFRGRTQGIGLFDGPYKNLTIRNNVISASYYHGISVYGGQNVVITNNTVINNSGIVGKSPWIGVFDQKNGTPSADVLVANNLAMMLVGASDATQNIVFSDNSVIFAPATDFVDIQNYDYHPTSGSGFIDTANIDYAPAQDIVGSSRPFGAGPDRGAYEVGGIPDPENGSGNPEVTHQTLGGMPMKRETVQSSTQGAMMTRETASNRNQGTVSTTSSSQIQAGTSSPQSDYTSTRIADPVKRRVAHRNALSSAFGGKLGAKWIAAPTGIPAEEQ